MNWLMYIGGGIIYCLVGTGIIVSMISGEKHKNIGIGLYLPANIMIWIWFCWEFIN